MSEKKYWQSFGELNQSEANKKALKDEFKEGLPIEALGDEKIFNAKTPRRDFLKYMGFSTAAAAIAASCEIPIKKAIPFVTKPDDLVPGIANYYACHASPTATKLMRRVFIGHLKRNGEM